MKDIKLTPGQRQLVETAQASAFPSFGDLSRLVRYTFGWNLESMTGRGKLEDVISDLVTRSIYEGQVRKLLEAAARAKPRNPEIKSVANALGMMTPPEGPVVASPANPPVSIALIGIVALLATVALLAYLFRSQGSQGVSTPTPTVAGPALTSTALAVTSASPDPSMLALLPSTTATTTAGQLTPGSPTPRVRVKRLEFVPPSPSDQGDVVCYVCTEGCGGVQVTIKVEVNAASDGSPNGEWVHLKEMDTPCYTEDNAPHWPNLDFEDGKHLVQVTIKDCDGRVDTVTTDYTLAYRQPGHPNLISPAPDAKLTSRTVTFQWQPALRATSYTLWVGTSKEPNETPIVHEILTGTVYTMTFPTDYAQLYWRIDAQNDKGRTQVQAQGFSILSTGASTTSLPLNAMGRLTSYRAAGVRLGSSPTSVSFVYFVSCTLIAKTVGTLHACWLSWRCPGEPQVSAYLGHIPTMCVRQGL